jgi:hypothetical protein
MDNSKRRPVERELFTETIAAKAIAIPWRGREDTSGSRQFIEAVVFKSPLYLRNSSIFARMSHAFRGALFFVVIRTRQK